MTLKMKSAVLDELIMRLRSGEYRQGQSALRKVAESGPDLFCCLGVLCEMAVEAGVIKRRNASHTIVGVHYPYADGDAISMSYLPDSVVDWAGIVSDVEKEGGFGDYHYEQRGQWGEDSNCSLAAMNDRGDSFRMIAAWMVANVERV